MIFHDDALTSPIAVHSSPLRDVLSAMHEHAANLQEKLIYLRAQCRATTCRESFARSATLFSFTLVTFSFDTHFTRCEFANLRAGDGGHLAV
jgi:hypothetical protein